MLKRGKKFQVFLSCLVVVSSSITLLGCSHSQSQTSSGSVTIIYEMWETNMTDYMKERIASFEVENPGIKVELKVPANYQTSSAEYWDALDETDKNQLPDVFVMNAPHFSTYQADGKMLPTV